MFHTPTKSELSKLLSDYFTGEIMQRPPKYSAVKIKGKRACDRVRAGEEVEIKPKKVTIFELKITEYKWPKITLSIHCSSGFYVRSLARDLGEKLGCGAICTKLKRTAIGNLLLKDAVDPENISIEKIIKLTPDSFSFPTFNISVNDAAKLKLGKKIFVPIINSELAAAFLNGQIVAFGSIKNGIFQPNKNLN